MSSFISKLQRLTQYWQAAGWLAVLRRIYVRCGGPRWAYLWHQNRCYQRIAPYWKQWLYHYWDFKFHSSSLLPPHESETWRYSPLIDIFIIGKEQAFVEQSLKSIQAQSYPHWHLHLLLESTSSELPNFRPFGIQAQIDIQWIPEGASFITAFNQVLQAIEGEWLILQFAGDQLAPHALYEVIKALQDREVDLVYSDDDQLSKNLQRSNPQFKPDWSPWYFLTHNYICNLCVFRSKMVRTCHGFKAVDGALYDLLLRLSENLDKDRILHIPQVLYHHWGEKFSLLARQWYGCEYLSTQRIQATLSNRQIDAEVTRHPHYPLAMIFPTLSTTPLVSIIIPFRDQYPILHQAITSILQKSTYRHFEIILVDNQSQPTTQSRVSQLLQAHSQLKLLAYPHPFNYSAINNVAVSQAQGEYVVLMNNDIEVQTPEWLEQMLAFAQFPEHGAIGVKLYYPNHLLQHGGIVTGIFGIAGHAYRYSAPGNPGYGLCLESIREVSAVTAACLMIRKELYHHVGGMDADHLTVAFNDVDFCLRLLQKGYSNLFLPMVEMIHYESLTRGKDVTPEQQSRVQQEIKTMQKRWGIRLFQDPYYNPNLTLEAEDFFLKFPVSGRTGP